MKSHARATRIAPDTPAERASHSFCVKIADIDFVLDGLTLEQSKIAEARFSPCICSIPEDRVSPRVQVCTRPQSFFSPRVCGSFYYQLALTHRPTDVSVSGMDFLARIDRRSSDTQLWVSPASEYFEGSLENTLRVVAAYELIKRDSLLLHSVALTDETRGYVCIGRSGAGKSTLAALAHARGLRVLSDELNAVPLDNRELRMSPVPFAGDFGRIATDMRSAPLTGIFALEQACDNFVAKASRAEAISRLIAACPYVNADPYVVDEVDSLAFKLAERYRVAILHFARNDKFWDTLIHDEC